MAKFIIFGKVAKFKKQQIESEAKFWKGGVLGGVFKNTLNTHKKGDFTFYILVPLYPRLGKS